jgi:hypothetical protein
MGFHRSLARDSSPSSAYRELTRICSGARLIDHPPSWLTAKDSRNDGYLLLEDERAVLPVRRGRVVACLVNPRHPAVAVR